MSEIKLVKRIKYAGDVHAALMQLGWDAKTAAAFLDSIPDTDAVEVVHCRDCKHCLINLKWGHALCMRNTYRERVPLDGFCSRGERKGEKPLLCADMEEIIDATD